MVRYASKISSFSERFIIFCKKYPDHGWHSSTNAHCRLACGHNGWETSQKSQIGGTIRWNSEL